MACPAKHRRVCTFRFTPEDGKRRVPPRLTIVALARPLLALIYSFLDMASLLHFAATARVPREACKTSPTAWPKGLHFGTLFHCDGLLPTGRVLRQIAQTIGQLDIIDTDMGNPFVTCREQALLHQEKDYKQASARAIADMDAVSMAQGFVSLMLQCRPSRLILHKTVHRMLNKIAEHQWPQLLQSVQHLTASEIQNSKAFCLPEQTALDWNVWQHMLLGFKASSVLTRLDLYDSIFTSNAWLRQWLMTLPKSLTDLDICKCSVSIGSHHSIPLPGNLTRLACSPNLLQFGEVPPTLRALYAQIPFSGFPTWELMSLRSVKSTLTELAIVGPGLPNHVGAAIAHDIIKELWSAPITCFEGNLTVCKHNDSVPSPLPPWPLTKLVLHHLSQCPRNVAGQKPATLADLANGYAATLTHLDLFTVVPTQPVVEWQAVSQFPQLKHLGLSWPLNISSSSSSDDSQENKWPLLETLRIDAYRKISRVLPDQQLLSMLQPFQSSLTALDIQILEIHLSPPTVLQLKSQLPRLTRLNVFPSQIDSPECIQGLVEWRLPHLNVTFDPYSVVRETLREREIEFQESTPFRL